MVLTIAFRECCNSQYVEEDVEIQTDCTRSKPALPGVDVARRPSKNYVSGGLYLSVEVRSARSLLNK